MTPATRACRRLRCGHERAAHDHYRTETNCCLCSCPSFRRWLIDRLTMLRVIYVFLAATGAAGLIASQLGIRPTPLYLVIWAAAVTLISISALGLITDLRRLQRVLIELLTAEEHPVDRLRAVPRPRDPA